MFLEKFDFECILFISVIEGGHILIKKLKLGPN